MDDIWTRIVDGMAGRVSGPMKLRLFLQPTIAAILAIRAGLQDAKAANPPYGWALFTNPSHRAELLKDGWKSVGKVFLIAFTLDLVYQFVAQRRIYPSAALFVAILLAIVPYLLLRGPVNRLSSRK